MYDTEERIELVKKRMYEYHRRQEWETSVELICFLYIFFGHQFQVFII